MNKNRLLAWSFALLACLTASALSFEVDGIKYSTTTGGVSVTGYNSNYTGNIVLNGTVTYDGTEYDVVSVGGSALQYCHSLTSVGDLPACRTIGGSAFNSCSSLTSVGDLPACTSIGYSAFNGCYYLTSVGDLSACTAIESYAFSNNQRLVSVGDLSACTSIGESAFEYCYELTSVGNLSACTSIGKSAFRYCRKLYSVNLSACETIYASAFSGCWALTSIGTLSACSSIGLSAFSGCSGLISITIPACLTSIGENVFYGCYGLESIVVDSDNPIYDSREGCNALIETASNTLIAGCKNTIIPTSVTSIESYAFYNCKNLTSITIPENVTKIGSYAFQGCSSLASVDGFFACTSIGSSAFQGCSSLTSVGDLPACTSIGSGAFKDCSSLTSVGDLPACTSIGSSAFSGCSSLTNVGDLSACTSIYGINNNGTSGASYGAFYGCCSLTSVGDLSACTSIGNYAFWGCSSLASVGDLSACSSIGSYAFYQCSSLTSMGDLPACTSIADQAFYSCGNLNKIVLSGETLSSLGGVLPTNVVVLVPESLLADYRAADIWKDMPAYQILPIGPSTDYDINVTALNNASAVHAAIGEEKLDHVINLKLTGTINSYDIMILRNKMHNLQNLDMTDVNIVANDYEYYTGNHTEDNVLGANSFNGSLCYLRSVKLPKTITEIGNQAFYQCANLSSVEIPAGACTSIGSQAFRYCKALTSIEIPEGVTSIKSSAFSNCTSLKSVTFPSTLVTIESSAFYYCTALTSIILPDNLRTIGQNAFLSCSSLAEVRIPSMMESIGNNAFASCTNLKDVYTYTLVPQNINQNTFASETYTTGTLHVQKTSFYPYYWNTQWSQFSTLTEFEGTYSQWLINNQTDYILDDETGVIDTEDDATGEIGAGSGLISENTDEDQEMDDIIIDDDGTTCGSLIGNGHLNSNWLHFRIKVTKGKWYFFCFPFRINLNDIASEGSYVFRFYDGSIRAQQGSGGWQNLPAGTEYLEPGVGYIFQSNKGGTLNIKVRRENLNLNPGTLLANLISHIAENVQNASWNFMGNPHTSYFDMDNTGYECPITVWNGSSYEAVRPGDDDYHFRPFQAFFVQKPADVSEIAFPAEWRETYNQSKQASQAKANRRRIEGLKDARMLINLVLSDGTHSDKTRVVFNKESSTDYETSCDAAKFMTAGVPQLYSLFTNVSYAINERPLGSVELGFQAPEKGEYTLSAVRMDQPVLLHDNVMNITFDLADGDYTFSSEAGVFNKRFMLTLNGDATGIGVLKEQTGVSVMAETGGISFSGVDGNEVAIYTTGGATMASQVGNEFVPLPSGTYIVKVDNLPTKLLVR